MAACAQEHKRSQSVAREGCILARVVGPSDAFTENPLDELTGLAETAGTNVLGGVVQRRESPDPKTYLGKGKVAELKGLVELHSAEVVIFDNDLSPSQTRNIEKVVGTKVLDRTELILDIFASNARTHEARLAVELAQLEYSLPRLKRMWTHLSRQTMGVGMRGPGEKQLEVDRRLVVRRIHELKLELAKVEKRKEREVAGRRDYLTVSLVGYTNARQEHADERVDLGRCRSGRQAVRNSGYAHTSMEPAKLGSGPFERYGRIYTRSPAPPGRKFPGHA